MLAGLERADAAGSYSAAAVAALVRPAPARHVPAPPVMVEAPAQQDIDRLLSVFEAWVQIEEAVVEVQA